MAQSPASFNPSTTTTSITHTPRPHFNLTSTVTAEFHFQFGDLSFLCVAFLPSLLPSPFLPTLPS